MFKIVYVNPNLPEDEKEYLQNKYSQLLTDNKIMAIVEVASVEQPLLLDNERLVIDLKTFEAIIEDIINAIVSNDQKKFEMIVNQIVNAKLN